MVEVMDVNGAWHPIQAQVTQVNANHFQVVIQGVPIWTRVDSFDNVPLRLNGQPASQVHGSNVTHHVPGSGTLTLQVLL
jgi:hypothetical protein